jgi:hypothetical protein
MSSSHSDQIAENPITCEEFVYSLAAFRDNEMTPPDRSNNCQRVMFRYGGLLLCCRLTASCARTASTGAERDQCVDLRSVRIRSCAGDPTRIPSSHRAIHFQV